MPNLIKKSWTVSTLGFFISVLYDHKEVCTEAPWVFFISPIFENTQVLLQCRFWTRESNWLSSNLKCWTIFFRQITCFILEAIFLRNWRNIVLSNQNTYSVLNEVLQRISTCFPRFENFGNWKEHAVAMNWRALVPWNLCQIMMSKKYKARQLLFQFRSYFKFEYV